MKWKQTDTKKSEMDKKKLMQTLHTFFSHEVEYNYERSISMFLRNI